MPVDQVFSYTKLGDTLNGTVERIGLQGFTGGGFALSVVGSASTLGGSLTGVLKETIINAADLDDNGVGDLVDALNAAKTELGITITAVQYRDLTLRMAQIAVENVAAAAE